MLLALPYNPLLPHIQQWGMEKLCQSSDIVGFTLSFAEGGSREVERSL